jgi:hypothetical protein
LDKNNKITPEIEQQNTYGIGDDFMISKIKIGKTAFIVSSYFSNGEPFPTMMEKVIEHKIKVI